MSELKLRADVEKILYPDNLVNAEYMRNSHRPIVDLVVAYIEKTSKEARRAEARDIFYLLWDEDGSPFQRDDPPREILNHLAELETE